MNVFFSVSISRRARAAVFSVLLVAGPASAQHPDDLRHANEQEMADGRPLYAQQVPRFVRPDHDGEFGFDDFLVLGDHPTATFTHWHWDPDEAERETWHRTTTRAVAGHLVSVFRPRWPASILHGILGRLRWGVDRPHFMLGRVSVPGATSEYQLRLSMAPPNIPESQVVRINDDVQFASHVVNIRNPDFDDLNAQNRLDFSLITRPFYEHFADEYEVIVLVHDAQHFGDGLYYHSIVRNDISGIGMELFDRSGVFGSAGVLQAVEGYPGAGGWTEWGSVFHEQGHQYGEYSKVWESLDPPLERRGWNPSGRTPLLFPGEVAYGAVLSSDRRVTRVRSAGQPDRFEIEPTMPFVRFQPLTLYRMGLMPASEVPDMLVFRDQGQFNETSNSSPEPGTAVTGETTLVTINDLMAADGVRAGPVVRKIRRAIVFVSREELVSKAQMDVLNYFARRLGTSSGVTSWDRFPSFTEATGGHVEMTTNIRPLHREALRPSFWPSSQGVSCAKVGTTALVGVRFDQEFGGCLTTGDTIRVSGRLTLTDRDDYNRICLYFWRYPRTEAEDRLEQCSSLYGDNRFSVEVTFPVDRPGGYMLSAYVNWPGSGHNLSFYTGAIELYADP